MTPLVDVMLVLVVIFIITAPLMTSAIKLDLPKTSTSANNPLDAPKFVTVVIDKSGQVYLNDQSTSLTQLAESLTQIANAKSDTEVQLRADETVAYGKVAGDGCDTNGWLESHWFCHPIHSKQTASCQIASSIIDL